MKQIDNFIETWGTLGVFWGINRSMARIHAYLLVSEHPVDLDTIANYLNISRGNASMCLKDLRQWGVIQRVHVSGDRRDFYVAEQDAWKMFFRILANRKTREFDPALEALQSILADDQTKKNKKVYDRLLQVEDLFTTINAIMTKGLKSEESSKAIIGFIKSFILKQKSEME